ncbi:hypothetical protein [Oceanobacillus sp. FSL W7-1293]
MSVDAAVAWLLRILILSFVLENREFKDMKYEEEVIGEIVMLV